MYEVEFVTSAAKEFRSLEDNIKGRIAVAIDALRQNPLPEGFESYGDTNVYIAYGLVHIECLRN